MKKIALKPVMITVPRSADRELAIMLQKAEATIRENNAIIEHAINSIESDGGSAELVNGILHIS